MLACGLCCGRYRRWLSSFVGLVYENAACFSRCFVGALHADRVCAVLRHPSCHAVEPEGGRAAGGVRAVLAAVEVHAVAEEERASEAFSATRSFMPVSGFQLGGSIHTYGTVSISDMILRTYPRRLLAMSDTNSSFAPRHTNT